MAFHHPDFSSSEDEFDDPEFKELMRQRRMERIQHHAVNNLTDEQRKKEKIWKIQNDIYQGNNEEVLKVINEDINLNEKIQDEWSVIFLAALAGNYDLVTKLYEMGADISSKRGSDTILMCACNCPSSNAPFEESAKVIEFLLDKGVDPTAKNRRRMNALMMAASNGNQIAVEFLIPLVDLNEEDNQCWDALFWAVYSGNASLVKFLIDKGMQTHRFDLRGTCPLDIAADHNYHDIHDLLRPEVEEDDEDYLPEAQMTFEEYFDGLKEREKPKFSSDVNNFLYGTRCENLIKIFAKNNVSLLDLLSSSEGELEEHGVMMPFQRRRIMAGLHRFHKAPFHPKSVPFVGKAEIYSNIDVSDAVISAVKQLICMNAALKYMKKNGVSSLKLQDESREIEQCLCTIQSKLRRLRKVVQKLQNRAAKWDDAVKPVNVITPGSGKRWFPWRKTIFILSVCVAVSVKLWRRPVSIW